MQDQDIPLPTPDGQPPILPESLEAEQAVLGAILLDPQEAILPATEKLRGNEFSSMAHRRIYKAMHELSQSGDPIDLLTIVGKLEEKGWINSVGGIAYLTQLANAVPTAANIGHYIGIVNEKHMHRELIKELEEQLEIARRTYEPGDVLQRTKTKLEALGELAVPKKSFRSLRDILPECFDDFERSYNNRLTGAITGVPSGFFDLDNMTSGFQNSDFIIVGARPSVGKTAFALNIARNASRNKANGDPGETVAIFSLEMSEKQLVNRLICAEGNIDGGKLRTGKFQDEDWEKISLSVGSLADANILIDDTPSINIPEIRAKCRKLQKERGLGLILIDYLQLIGKNGRAQPRQEEISEISRNLKLLARELDVPVIALSQLSRGVEGRQDKRPMMSDLRDSGSLEQDADIVMFLYRDDYYDKGSEKRNIIEIIIAKQRNGPVGTVELVFFKQFNRFANLDRKQAEYAEQLAFV